MTTYYVSPDGRDGNDGAETTPWKTLGYALAMTAASDEIILIDSTKTAPHTDILYPPDGAESIGLLDAANAETIRGDGMQYIWRGLNVTHGSERPELIPNSNMDGWTDVNTLFRLTSSGATKETTDVDTRVPGRFLNSASCDNPFEGVTQQVYLVSGRTYRIETIAKVTALNGQWLSRIRNIGTGDYFNFNNGTWGSNVPQEWGTPNGNVYEDLSTFVTFDTLVPTSSAQHEIVTILASKAGDDTGLVQYISIKDIEANNWTDEGGDVWSLPGMVVGMSVNSRVLVTPVEDWSENGTVGFASVTTGYKVETVEATMIADEGTFYFDSTTRELKIHIPAGSTITDYHIEVMPNMASLTCTSDVTLGDFTIGGAYGISAQAGMTVGISANNCHVVNNCNFAWNISAGTDNQLTFCSAKRTRGRKDSASAPVGDGFSVLLAGVKMTCTGCTAEDTCDEGFENSQTAEIVCIGSTAIRSGWEKANESHVSAGFKKTNGGDATFNYCTAVDCQPYGFGNDDVTQGGALTITGSIGKNSTWADFRLSPSTLGNTGTFAINECIGATQTSADDITPWDDGTNNQLLANNDIKVNSDGTLQSDFTEAVGTGSKWWTGINPVSSNGEPYANLDVDKGGNQSTHGPFHPVNL